MNITITNQAVIELAYRNSIHMLPGFLNVIDADTLVIVAVISDETKDIDIIATSRLNWHSLVSAFPKDTKDAIAKTFLQLIDAIPILILGENIVEVRSIPWDDDDDEDDDEYCEECNPKSEMN